MVRRLAEFDGPLVMVKSLSCFGLSVQRTSFWLVVCLGLLFSISYGNAECLSEDLHLNCFSKNLLLLANDCSSSATSYYGKCTNILPADGSVTKDWISVKLVGAWYQLKLPKAFKMTKVIVQQRSAANPQIKELDVEFDTGPNLQMTLTRNINGTPDTFDEMSFASRSSSTVKFTVLSLYPNYDLADLQRSVQPGFKNIQIYDENCDRDYQELNMEHHSLTSDTSLVRSWSTFTGFLKMFLTFHDSLTLYFSGQPSIKANTSFLFKIDTQSKQLIVFKSTEGKREEITKKSFSYQFDSKKGLLFIKRNTTHWEIGHSSGVVITVADTTQHRMKYWGIACSSLKPVELTYWKHIGKCYEKADYFWLADKLIGGTIVTELRQGKDAQITDLNEVQTLPFGPLVHGHTSSSLYLTGVYSGGFSLAKFHKGCLADLTTCSSGYTLAFWVSVFDAKPVTTDKVILWLSEFGLQFFCKDSDFKVEIRSGTKVYTAHAAASRTKWTHVFLFWDPVKGLKVLLNNKDEIDGSITSSFGPSERPGFTDFQVGRRPGLMTHSARIAIRDIALWERRISLNEAHEYYHCNNFEIPQEFSNNPRTPLTEASTFPFPGQNIASAKHGGTCNGCYAIVDGDFRTGRYHSDHSWTFVIIFSQVYIVNKVVFRGYKFVDTLTIKFSDATSEKFVLANSSYEELHFPDKSTDSVEMLVEGHSSFMIIYEISVHYDFSTDRIPTRFINWAHGGRVKGSGSTPLLPTITDGLISSENPMVVATETSSGSLFTVGPTSSPVGANDPYGTPPVGSTEPYSIPFYGKTDPYGTPPVGSTEPYSTPSYGKTDPYGTPPVDSTEPYSTPSYGKTDPYGTPPVRSTGPYSTPSYGKTEQYGVPAVGTTKSYGTSQVGATVGVPTESASSNWARIELVRTVMVNLLRIWLVNDNTKYDHLEYFTLAFSTGGEIQCRVSLPSGSNKDTTYSRDFIFNAVQTNLIDLRFTNTHERTKKLVGITEVELFFDTVKSLPASKTIIDENSVRTWEQGLSSAKLGAFDFLLNFDVKMDQSDMRFLRRKTEQNSYETIIRASVGKHAYIRIGTYYMYSRSSIANNFWHNVKYFYNARESRLSLFIDNRLESTTIALLPEEPDGCDWLVGTEVDSRFNGSLKNFRIHQAVRGFGVETKKILDSALSVSSASSNTTGANMARLNGPGAWVIASVDNDQNQYIQVDLGTASHVLYVGFQGKDNMWVTWARMAYSLDGLEWTFLLDIEDKAQIFRASHDADSIAFVMLYSRVVARYLRIYPYLANVGMAMRMEVYDHDYGLPFNSMVRRHVPSYQGCVLIEELSQLNVFLPLSYKSLASTPESCKKACALENYKLAVLFQGAICYCTKVTSNFTKLSDDLCSFPCLGNPLFRCGGETSVSLYDTEFQTDSLCTDCVVGIYADQMLGMFEQSEIFANSSGETVSYIDLSLNGIHMTNLTTGHIIHRFLDNGQSHLVAEAKDIQGKQVAVSTKRIIAQYAVRYPALNCPDWVRKGDPYECYLTVQRGTGMNLNCTIDGENLPLEADGTAVIKSGDIIPDHPAPVANDPVDTTIILPDQVLLLSGIIVAFEFISTGPGSLTIKVFRPRCGVGMSYCQTTFICTQTTSFRQDCPQSIPSTTAHTFPSTGKICDVFDVYCPTRKLVSDLVADYELRREETFEFSKAGVHLVVPSGYVVCSKGDLIGYSGAVNLQHKASGVSFRAEFKQEVGLYIPISRIDNRTSLLRAHVVQHARLEFEMNRTGEFNCTFGNDVDPESVTASTYINEYEEIKDVAVMFTNISATNQSVLFAVPPHPGEDVSYIFRFGQGEEIVYENQNSRHNFSFNYTFTESGHYQVNLTVRNFKSVFNVLSGIHVLDAIAELVWPCPFYVRVGELSEISLTGKSGENVTIIVHYGDESSATVGPFNFGPNVVHTVSNTYKTIGTYNISLVANNAVSNFKLTGVIIAMEVVCNVSLTMATEYAHTGVPLLVSASVSKGSDVEYLVIFECTETGEILPEQPFTAGQLVMDFAKPCLYNFTVLAYNNVSAEVHNGSLLVEDPTIVNLRGTVVGLAVAGETTMLKAEVDSGGVVDCIWEFGDGDKTTVPFTDSIEHTYVSGGKYVISLNCSNPMMNANTSLDVEVLTHITKLDITPISLGDSKLSQDDSNTFPVEYPLRFDFTTDCQFVNFAVNFGDLSPPLLTNKTSVEHLFPNKFGSYDVTVNVSNTISYKVASISLTLLQSVKDVVVDTNGPVKLGDEVIFEVTMGQMGTYPCYYFNLGDGTELIYKGAFFAKCPPEYNHVTDIRHITSQVKISFAHTYINVTVYPVTCVGSNPFSSETVKTEAVIVNKPCASPIVSIEGFAKTLDDAREFMRSEEFEVITKNSIDCEATTQTDFEWKIFKVSPDGFSEEESVEIDLPGIKTNDWKIVFKTRSLTYGLYYIRFTLTMVGVGVSSSDYGYMKIIPSSIVAEVRGGSTRIFGFNKMIELDGGISRDPDVEEGNYEDMNFFWHCKSSDDNYTFPFEPEVVKPPMKRNATNSTQFVDYGGCFGHGPGRLNYSDKTFKIHIDTGLMRENSSYILQLLVKKDFRRSVFNLFIEVIPGNPPTIELTCLRNCLERFNPTTKISLEATCQDCRSTEYINYRWEVYLYAEGSWVKPENIDDVILTRPSSPNLVIKEESLLGNRTYKFRARVWRPGGMPGVAELIRTVNIPPYGGWCIASPLTGYALDTKFGVTCGDWIDENLPLKYTFSYSPGKGTLESLVYVGQNSFSPNVTFPTGQEENNTLLLVVLVTDSLDATTLVKLVVQVKETNTEKLKSQVEDLTASNGTLGTMLSSGDTQNAFQMISAVGNMLNFESEKNANIEPADTPLNDTDTSQDKDSEAKTQEKELQAKKEENTKLRTSLVNVISTAPVKTLEDAHRTSSVLGTVTKETGEVSEEAQDTATSTLDAVGDVLENAAEKPGTHPRTVAKTAESVLSGIGNVIQAAFYVEEPTAQEPTIVDQTQSEGNEANQKSEIGTTEEPTVRTDEDDDDTEQKKERKKQLANKLMTVVKKVAKAVTTNKAPGEQETRIDTPHLSLEACRDYSEDLNLKSLAAGAGSFALPNMGSMLNGSGIIDVATVATPTNPFVDEFKRVHSVVMTTEMRNASGGISVFNLDEPIDIRLPRDPKPVPSNRLYQATSGKMIFHKFEVKHNDSSINIDLYLVGNCSERVNFSLFLQKDQKPSVSKHMFNITIPDPKSKVHHNSSKSPNTFFVSNIDLKRDARGTFFVGLMYNRPDLDCPEFMNYTLDIFTSGCLYFDEEQNAWKGDGCEVGFLTNMNETQCLCNHLTSFGGDFVVPPNSIDWDAVSAGFTNLDQNPLVFAVVISIIGVYFILLVWVRRLDKKDLEEFVTIPLPDNDPRDNYNYEVVVYTGHSKYSGTTANVFLAISGKRDETEPRALLDVGKTALKPGGVDTFLLSVPSTLGKLDHVRIWHDNTGESPSWYLSRILIRDVQTNRKTWFLCDQWLAVEENDGKIERVLLAATKDDLVSFNFLFSIEARRKLFDDHLWFSVLSRRPRSQFTRAQRLSCCLAVLLSTMLANAMFYQTDDSSSSGNQVRAGPLVFSLKQLWIGFISCLVILPVNLLIVYIFRNVRPKQAPNDEGKNSDIAQKYEIHEENETELLSDPTENLFSCSKKSLPRKFIYVAYILLFLTIAVSASFTIFYGFTFGKQKSEEWISSTLLSFVQDLMLLQPLKVFAAAAFIALIIKDPSKVDQGDKGETKPEIIEQDGGQQPQEDEEQSISGDDSFRMPKTPRSVVKPPSEYELETARELRTKQKIMRSIISEVCWYIAYLILISIVAYGNRDPKAYYVTRTMNDLFVENKYSARLRLNDITTVPQYWSWLYNSILPAINAPYWYGPYGLDDIETISKTIASKSRAKAKSKSSKTKSSGDSDSDEIYHSYPKRFTADRAVSYLIGVARTRQLRNTLDDSCAIHPTVKHLHRGCSVDYSWSNEDEGCYNVSWSAFNGSKHNCKEMEGGKSPWTYRTAWELKGTPFWGKFHNYWGGGYVWNLDSSLSTVQKESKLLEDQSWLDHQTRATFFEFTIYNAFTNFFCSVTLLLERQNTGGVYPYGQLHTLRLYHYVGAEAIVTVVCEIIFVGVLCYIFCRELKEARSQGIRSYFKDPWNYFDILGLLFSFTAIGLYFARMTATSLALKQINENPNKFVSFHYVSAIDQSFTILLAFAIFVYFLKVLRLLRFNRKISLLSTTLIACTETLVGFMITYMLLFAAYAQLMYLVYGRDMAEFSSYHRCLSSLMEMTLGSSDFDQMNATNRILTALIFFSYTLLNMCVYMNLLVSILSETFSEVRADVLLQPNDHEIVDFVIKSIKKTVFSAVEPITRPLYKEPKDDIDVGIDKISETSECIQGALQGLCKEDIRQTLWFGNKSKLKEKKVLFTILLESGEIFTENDLAESVPMFDDILKKLTMSELLVIRDKQRRKIAADLANSIRSTRASKTNCSPRECSAILFDDDNNHCDDNRDDDNNPNDDYGDDNYPDNDNDGDNYRDDNHDGDNYRDDDHDDENYRDDDYDDDNRDSGANTDSDDNDGGGCVSGNGDYHNKSVDGDATSIRDDYDSDNRQNTKDGDGHYYDSDDSNTHDSNDVGNVENNNDRSINQPSNDTPSDSEGSNHETGNHSDCGTHSEIPGVQKPNQSIVDLHDFGRHEGYDGPENTENFRSSSQLSPRSSSCVISMDLDKEDN